MADGSREPRELDLAATRARLAGHGLRVSFAARSEAKKGASGERRDADS